MTAVDWSKWCKCPVCFANSGQPCWSLSGRAENVGELVVALDRPHNSRKPRAVKS